MTGGRATGCGDRDFSHGLLNSRPARVAKLADALDLGSSAARRAGSSPASRIELKGSQRPRKLRNFSGADSPAGRSLHGADWPQLRSRPQPKRLPWHASARRPARFPPPSAGPGSGSWSHRVDRQRILLPPSSRQAHLSARRFPVGPASDPPGRSVTSSTRHCRRGPPRDGPPRPPTSRVGRREGRWPWKARWMAWRSCRRTLLQCPPIRKHSGPMRHLQGGRPRVRRHCRPLRRARPDLRWRRCTSALCWVWAALCCPDFWPWPTQVRHPPPHLYQASALTFMWRGWGLVQLVQEKEGG